MKKCHPRGRADVGIWEAANDELTLLRTEIDPVRRTAIHGDRRFANKDPTTEFAPGCDVAPFESSRNKKNLIIPFQLMPNLLGCMN